MRKILYPLALLIAPESASAGAWTQPQGEGLAIVTAAHSRAQDEFRDDGQAIATKPFEKFELRAYGEYGLTDWATVVAQSDIRFKERDGEDSKGLGRVDLGARFRLWHDDFSALSVEGSVSAPGSSDRLAPLNGGDTEWELDGRVLYGRGFSLGWRHGFFDVQVGYRLRFDDPADELRGDLTLGLDLTEKTMGMLQLTNSVSIGSAKAPYAATTEHTLTLSTVYRYDDKWSFQSGTFTTAAGRNVLRENGLFFAIWRRF